MRVFNSNRLLTGIFILLMAAGSAAGRTSYERPSHQLGMAAVTPAHNIAVHRGNNVGLAVTNSGTFGLGFYPAGLVDAFTGDPVIFSCEYPRGSSSEYLFAGALWVGAVVGQDTLVSTGADGWTFMGAEMHPDAAPFGYMIKRSAGDPGAVSHEDYIATYTDTYPGDFDHPHIPLSVEITQSSYAWSYVWAEDLVLMEYQIKNIGAGELNDVYVGIYVDADIYNPATDPMGFQDDLSGFLTEWTTTYGSCEFQDTVNVAWSADNDGDFSAPSSVLGVSGLSPVGVPGDNVTYAFNWWISNGNAALDFGPRMKPTPSDPWRDFGTGGIGTPEGDRNKYYIMRHSEFDYDQAYTAVIPVNDPIWMYPNQALAADFADGFDTRYLLSVGPFDISPGVSLPMTIAYVGGRGFHTVEDNLQNLPEHPEIYYSNLDFSDLAQNARWAGWVYDNPGVDTDSDGYFGPFRVCCDGDVCDTFFYEGDGVPDFDAASNPAAGDMVWLEPREEALWARWNGLHAETAEDFLTGRVDFEGYRVYLSPDGSSGSFVEVESYDLENYLKYTWSPVFGWELREYPMTATELRCLYGASCDDLSFDPTIYTETSPYIMPGFPDSIFYFEAFGLNKSSFGVTTQILKRYPGQPYPTTLDPALAPPEELTEDGYLKYFEYEMTIGNLLAGECYYVNITRTDYGAPHFGIPGDESDLVAGDVSECTLPPEPGYNYDAGWTLVSAPVDLDSPLPSDVFGDDLPFWQLYGWDGSGYYSPTEVNGCGEGYWLFAPEATVVDYAGVDCPSSGPFGPSYVCLQADSGWNLLGSLSSDSLFIESALFYAHGEMGYYADALTRGWIARWMYFWTGSGYSTTLYLDPGSSCWLASTVDDLEICWQSFMVAPERESQSDLFATADDHTLTIRLLGTSEAVQLGVDEQATNGFDSKLDMPSPPPAPGVSAGLVIVAEHDPMWNRLRTDLRPFADKISWQLNVMGTESQVLEFTNMSALTQHSYSISLMDNQGKNIGSADEDRTFGVPPGSYFVVAHRLGQSTGLVPDDYSLSQNYPNPFNPRTTIQFGLPSAGHVRLEVFNLLGQKVITLADDDLPAGIHEVVWDGRAEDGQAVSSGLYFYRLETAGFSQSRKMLLIK